MRIAELIHEFAARSVHVDVAISEIADQNIAGELTKTGGGECHSPGRIELPLLRESLLPAAIEIESVHNAVALTGQIVVLRLILYGIADKELSVHQNYVEWCIAFFQFRVKERTRRQIARCREGVVIHLNFPGTEIGNVQQSPACAIGGDCQSLVHSAVGCIRVGGIVDCDNRECACLRFVSHRVKAQRIYSWIPAENRSIFCREQKRRRCRGRLSVRVNPRDLESAVCATINVEDESCRCSRLYQPISRPGNGNYQSQRGHWNRGCNSVKRGDTRVIVRNPK